MYPQSIFLAKYENCRPKNQLEIVIFTAVKNRCMLHGHVQFFCNSLLTKPGKVNQVYPDQSAAPC